MKKLLTILLVVGVIFSFNFSAAAENNKLWQPNFNLEMRTQSDDSLGKVGVVYPLISSKDSIFYTDFRTMFSSDDVSEWNLGLGYRHKSVNDKYILGGYVFRDYRDEYDANWNQWTVGGELLTKAADFRLNLYYPIKDEVLANSSRADQIITVGNELRYQASTLDTYYEALHGYDFEIGRRFSDNLPFDIGVYLRTFKFSGDDSEDVSGNGVKVNTQFGNPDKALWTFGFDWQDDDVRGNNFETTLGVSIPFGGQTAANRPSQKSKLARRMTEAPNRDIDIIVNQTKEVKKVISESAAVDPETGKTITSPFYVTVDGTGDGSKSNPAGLKDLSSGSGLNDNDIVVLLGDKGDFKLTDSLTLQNGNKLLSPGGAVRLGSAKNNSDLAYFKPTGTQATLTSANDINLIELAHNNTVSGINFVGSQDSNIIAINSELADNNSNNLTISNNSFSNLSQGIFIKNGHTNTVSNDSNSTKITINNNQFDNLALKAIHVSTENTADNQIEINNNSLTGEFNNGITVDTSYNKNDKLNIKNNYLEAASASAISVHSGYSAESSQITVANNTIDQSNYGAIDVDLTSSAQAKITIANNQINQVTKPKLYKTIILKEVARYPGAIYLSANDIDQIETKVINNTINDSMSNGITIAYNNNNISKNKLIKNNADSIYSNKILVDNNIIKKSDGSAISIAADGYDNTEFTVSNNQIGQVLISSGVYGVSAISSSGAIALSANDIDQIKTQVINNIINDSETVGIKLDYYLNNNLSNSILIDNNIIQKSNESAIAAVTRDTLNTDLTISNNQIAYVSGRGIRYNEFIVNAIDTPTGAISVAGSSNLTSNINNNTIENSQIAGIIVDYRARNMTDQKSFTVDNTINSNNLGNIAGNAVELLYNKERSNTDDNYTLVKANTEITNNQVRFSAGSGVLVEALNFTNQADKLAFNVSNNLLNRSLSNGLVVLNEGIKDLQLKVNNNQFGYAGQYGINLESVINRNYDYDSDLYIYYPAQTTAAISGNIINQALAGGIGLYTESMGNELAKIIFDQEKVISENSFGSSIDPLIKETNHSEPTD